jgi:hypothetical protein
MFNLIMFLDISDGQPGMLVPVLSSPNTNLPYVQQMDEFLEVTEIIPFIEYESYPTVPSEEACTVAIGDSGLIAFRSFDGSIFCGSVREVLIYVAENRELIAKNPLLRSQLHRIEAAELNPSYDEWRAVAAKVFTGEEQRKFWLDSELQLYQKQKRIWAELEPQKFDGAKVASGGHYASISEYSTEYIIRLLSQRSSFANKDWTKIWHYINERIPFDDRVYQIALNWMFWLNAESQEFGQTKSVVYALLERCNTFGHDMPELSEFLLDCLTSDRSLVFELLRPKRLFAQVFGFLPKHGEIGEVVALVEFCISELPKEGYVVQALKAALTSVISQTSKNEDPARPSSRNRDFSRKQIERAQSLWLRLDECTLQNEA